MARILVVDDDRGFREFAIDLLTLTGHDVSGVCDGEKALERLRKRSFHVVLTDMKMPRVDGITLLKTLRAEQPEVEVLILTAHGTIKSAVEAMRMGAYHYLQKPLESNDALRISVARAVERRTLRDRVEEQESNEQEFRLTWGAPIMKPVLEALRRVAETSATVLLLGESGVGKEVVARRLHQWSKRAQGPFIAVNCAGFSETLMESELFGHERGAFTGASASRRGRLELADGGTFFLDELGSLKLTLQARLLRVLQDCSFERIGGNRTITSDVRFVSATNCDLSEAIEFGHFREDLYHRLSVFPIRIPPLRERREDIIPLANDLLTRIGPQLGKKGLQLSGDAQRLILGHPWRGNVRELSNALERAVIMCDGPKLTAANLWLESRVGRGAEALVKSPPPLEPGRVSHAIDEEGLRLKAPIIKLETLEREMIQRAMDDIGTRKQAAEALGIGLRTLYEKIKRYGLN